MIVGAALVASVLFAGSSFGSTSHVQPQALQTTESPTPSESASESPKPDNTESPTPPPPTGPAVQLLNPAAEPLPNLASNELGDMRQVSDKFDGTDEAFHVVAVTRQAPTGAVVEAFFQPDGGEEVRVGELRKVAGSSDTWELFWDIPENFPQGVGEFKAKLFNASGRELSKDIETVEINSEEDTVEMTWPTNDGRLGFFKPRTGGEWRTVIDGTASEFTSRVYVYYTTTALGEEPKWSECIVGTGTTNSYNISGVGQPREFQFFCALTGKDTPSQVTGFALIATGRDDPLQPSGTGIITEESSDVHRVHGFAQDVRKMSIALEPFQAGSTSASYPSPQHREAGTGCLVFGASVTDQQKRPVVGASVDVHLEGPDDEAGFGNNSNDSASKAPDAGGHANEEGYSCSGSRTDAQGQHENPSGTDTKHRESIAGTGMSPSSVPPGTWRFSIYSPVAGISNLQAWVDDAPLADESGTRGADNDKLGTGEASTRFRGYWLAAPAKVTITPTSDSAVTGSCNTYTVSAQGGRIPVAGINVDVHASGPTNDLDFCTPSGGSALSAPEDGDHEAEDDREAVHPSEDPETPNTQHTEGVTGASGLFTFGITSPVAGDSSLQAWLDGYPGQDNDARASSEPTASATKSWATTAHDAEVRFVNPSGYGGSGDNVSNKNDGDTSFHVVTRVDVPELVPGVEIYLSDGSLFRKLGDATRIGDSDTFEFHWNTEDTSGTFTLRAQIAGTEKKEDRRVTIDNSLETIRLVDPANDELAPFVDRKTPVEGFASAGAEGVTFYYTQTGAKDVNSSARWIECGSVELPTSESGPQPFSGECTLAEGDSPTGVTGIAALATTCDPLAGCDAPLGSVDGNTGDAHRVFGLDSAPVASIQLGNDGSSAAGKCRRVEVVAQDQTGTPLANANVDVHLSGPGDEPHFCNVDGGSDRRGPTEGGHSAESGESDERFHAGSNVRHTEGETGDGGRFIVGIISGQTGTSRLTAWVDVNDDDVVDGREDAAEARFRWGSGGGGGSDSRGCTITGTDDSETLVGTNGDDVICGLGGRDTIRASGGNDIVYGDKGNDVITGATGNDRLYGGPGRDILTGGDNKDRLYGNSGKDVLKGGKHGDRLAGGARGDVLRGLNGNDVLVGHKGPDSLNGGKHFDRCDGGKGRDRFRACEKRGR